MPRQDHLDVIFPLSRKILSKFSKLSAILKHWEKLCDTDVNCASVLKQIKDENRSKCENNLGYYMKQDVFQDTVKRTGKGSFWLNAVVVYLGNRKRVRCLPSYLPVFFSNLFFANLL